MIDFEPSEEHLALQKTVREFCAGEVAPFIKEWDEKQHFEPSVFDKMAELGLLGVCIPEQYGGVGGVRHFSARGDERSRRLKLFVALCLGNGRAEIKISHAAGERRKIGDFVFRK